MKKVILLITALVYLSGIASGQDFTALSKAFKLSYSLENENKFDEAVAELKTVYDAGSYELNLRLGWLSYRAGSYTESMDYYLNAIALKPFAIEARLGFVIPAAATGNYKEVEAQYTSILAVDPMNTKANYWMGVICYNREQLDLAYKYFEKVANLYPFDYDSIIMYAWTNYKLHNLREAKVLFQKALLIRPDDSSALEGLGKIQ
jgi:tetratricopeptide (TPR) repeat protein